ncbi:MAG: mandelate racemase/muconate lactonizing enzyme family protein [Candidatus Bathyarchaeia archaeon]
MIITRMEIIPIVRSVKGGIGQGRISRAPAQVHPAILIKLHTDEGIVGYGELGGGSATIAALQEQFAPILLGEDPFNIDKIVHRIENELIYGYVTNITYSFIQSAVEVALYDIVGKKLNVPVYNLLGGAHAKKFPMSWPIHFGSAEENAKEAALAYSFGFKCFKVKVGMESWPPGSKDEERLKKIRETIGYDAVLTLDANERWSPSEAIKILNKRLAKYEIAYVEQPVPQWDIDGMARVRKESEILVAACESAVTIRDVVEIIKKEAADIIHLKIARSGGFYRSKQIIGMAEAAGLSWTLSSMAGGVIECAVNTHFAASTMRIPEPPFAYEIGGSVSMNLFRELFEGKTDVKVEDVAEPIPKIENGYIYVPEGPGLGVEVSEDKIKRFMREGKQPIIIEKK